LRARNEPVTRKTSEMYEHRRHNLLSWPEFIHRALRHVLFAVAIVAVAVGIGTLGYHWFGNLAWLDAFLNASMILGGMGPVDRMETAGGKLFAALYALASGLVFIGIAGVIALPWVHRIVHWVHLDDR
jgi:hypothetical protein